MRHDLAVSTSLHRHGQEPSNGWSILLALATALFALFAASGCKRFEYVSTRPLDEVGFSYSAIEQLRGLYINDAEVAELVKAKAGNVSEQACIELVRAARTRRQRFTEGAVVADLHSGGLSDDVIVELGRLDQFGPWLGEAQAIHLAGISDRILLAVARRRSEGKPALSGGSLARLKNAGLSESTIYELTVRGIADAEAEYIADTRLKKGFSEADILRSFPPKEGEGK